MKIILLTDIPHLGRKREVVEVKDGYAQNILIPQKKAILATPQALKELEKEAIKSEEEKVEENKQLKTLLSKIKKEKLTIKAKVNDKGVLFKSISSKEIIEKIKEKFRVEVKNDYLKMEHLKNVGKHKITLEKEGLKGDFEIEIVKEE